MIILFVTLVLVPLIWLIVSRMKFEKYDLDKTPGPPGLPILGNIFDILTDRVSIFYLGRKWSEEYNGIYKIQFLSTFYSMEISNPDDIETIVTTPAHNNKGELYKFVKPWLREGLLVSEGQKWHERRKILTPAFHFNILRHFTTILEENSQEFVKLLEHEVGKDKTDIIPIISGYTLNSICETSMGTKLEESKTLGQRYKKAIQEFGSLLVLRLTTAWLHVDFIFNMSSFGRKQKKILKIIREFPSKVINDRRQFREKYNNNVFLEDNSPNQNDDSDIHLKKNKRRMALLDILLSAEKENKIDEAGIQEEVDTFMFEGHDTVATALNFALMLLANHKNIQDKIVEELKEIFGESDRIATMEDLNQLKYLECCIKESLRIYPSVHMIGRRIGEKVTLSNYEIPEGTMCNIHIYDLHRRSDLYPNPLVFDPDRFLPENCVGRHPFAYLPFSAGSRNCIGQKFAMLEMKSAIAAILRRLELLPITKPEDIVISGDVVLRTTEPIYIKFVQRVQ